jgi:hypothetical protein
MAPSALSWKLNKAELAKVEEEAKAAEAAARAAGMEDDEVEAHRTAKAKEVERRLKQEKFDRRPSAAGAAAAAVPAAPAPAPADPHVNMEGNHMYLADLETAINTILGLQEHQGRRPPPHHERRRAGKRGSERL